MIKQFNSWPREMQNKFILQAIAEEGSGQAPKDRPGIVMDFAANMAIVFILDPFSAKAYPLPEGIKHFKAVSANTQHP